MQGVTSNHVFDHYSMNCLYSFATESTLKSHENVCKDYDYCHVVILEVSKKILKYNQDKKSIYVDNESLLQKNHARDNDPENSSTT